VLVGKDITGIVGCEHGGIERQRDDKCDGKEALEISSDHLLHLSEYLELLGRLNASDVLVIFLMTKANCRFAFNRYEENKVYYLPFYKIWNLMQYIKTGLKPTNEEVSLKHHCDLPLQRWLQDPRASPNKNYFA
jgi:hypothetical protein